MILKTKNNKQKVFYYTDELNDDFGNLPLSKKDINDSLNKYKYTRGNSFRRFWCNVFYFCIVHPILHLFCFFFGIKKEGRDNLKEYVKKCKEIGKGGFIYGNHVSNFDAFTNQAYVFYKRCNAIGFSDSLANPFLSSIMNACGYFPLPNSIDQYKRFLNSMKELNSKGEHMIIFPEAHIWPYYTKIRPFVDGSFGYPVKFNVPSIPIITVFKKRKFFKKPRRVILIGKYVMPKEDLKPNENKKYVRDEIYKSMCELASKYDQQEYIKYVKVTEEELERMKNQK